MKAYLTSTIAFLSIEALGQAANIAFTNYLPPGLIDAPVFDSDCTTRLTGNAYLAQVYAGLAPEQLERLGRIVGFNTPPPGGIGGYILGDAGGPVPGAGNGQIVYVQLRAWQASAGATYEAAVAGGGKYGYSNIVPMPAYEAPGPPTWPFGLQSFCLVSGPTPRLAATVPVPGSVLLSWTAPSNGFVLQQNSSLGSTNWVTVTNAVSVAGTNNQFKVSAYGGAMFYRLVHPEPSSPLSGGRAEQHCAPAICARGAPSARKALRSTLRRRPLNRSAMKILPEASTVKV